MTRWTIARRPALVALATYAGLVGACTIAGLPETPDTIDPSGDGSTSDQSTVDGNVAPDVKVDAPVEDAGSDALVDADADADAEAAAPTFSVGVTVTGLTPAQFVPNDSIQLVLNGGTPITVSADGVSTFPEQLLNQAAYTVSFASSNAPLFHSCSIGAGASGTIANGAVNVTVTCALNYRGTVRASNPSAYFRLEETAPPVIDEIGNLQGTATFGAGGAGTITFGAPGVVASGKSISFAGTTGYIDVPYASALNAPQDFTIEAWITPAAPPPAPCDTGCSNPATCCWQNPVGGRGNGTGYYLRLAGANVGLQFQTGLGAGSGWNGPAFPLSAAAKVHAVGVSRLVSANVNQLSLYQNGTLVSSGQFAYAMNTVAGAVGFRIGALGDSAGTFLHFNGKVDEVAYYPRALSVAEVSNHFTVGSAE